MAMDNTFPTLVYCLLVISFAVAQTEKGNFTTAPTTTTLDSKTTFVTSSNSATNTTVFSNETENTSPYTSTTINETTSHTQTSQSTTIMTPQTNSTSQITTPDTHTPPVTAPTTAENQTTMSYKSTPNTTTTTTTTTTTAYSSHTVNTTTEDRTTQGLGLNISEKSMTIIFSVTLGLFAVVLVVLMFHRCKHKIQYLHQPLNNTGDTDVFVADDDALVISGGLYDGHPIYDNVPTAPEDQSQFRLEFLH